MLAGQAVSAGRQGESRMRVIAINLSVTFRGAVGCGVACPNCRSSRNWAQSPRAAAFPKPSSFPHTTARVTHCRICRYRVGDLVDIAKEIKRALNRDSDSKMRTGYHGWKYSRLLVERPFFLSQTWGQSNRMLYALPLAPTVR
jgi:hypothetical protein